MSATKDKKDEYILLEGSTSTPSVSTSFSTQLESLPLEVETPNFHSWDNILQEILEVVFQKLVEYQDDSSIQTILTCRLINKHWKSIADSVMETSCLSMFNKVFEFELSSHQGAPIDKELSSFIPSLEVVPQKGYRHGTNLLEKVSCPHFLLDDVVQGSPFPSKSVIFKGDEERNGIMLPKSSFKDGYHPVSVLKLVGNIGKTLSSAVFYKVTFPSPYFAMVLLNEMTNLKALLFTQVTLLSVGEADFGKKYKLSPLPHLKILKLHLTYVVTKLRAHSGSERGVTFNNWLTESYGKTLTHLEVYEAEYFTRIPTRNNFVNLKVLTIFHACNFTIQNSETLPHLQKLSLFYLADEDGDILFEDYSNFLQNFAPTLVYLKLQLWVDDVKSEESDFSTKIVTTFPNLNEFWYPYPRSRKDVAVLRYFLERFPKLTKLNLSWGSGMGMDVVEREDFWSVCPDLQRIYVYSSSNEQEDAIVTYRKTSKTQRE
ncbi:unnamed protein product [Orchesella dallaii]|uniref:F-box domain-containing protein n=1 Tax=Orchesella dallaii TaxID=48710 RepID=A0ABP1PT81_9HEXA